MAQSLAGVSPNNPFLDFLEYEPEAAYYSSPKGWTGQNAFAVGSPNQRRYYQNQFQNIYNEFLGALGQEARRGEAPSMRWTDYLENIPWAERYSGLSPEMAGRTTSRYAPGTRQIYF
jgi:hypothetical protein